MDDLSSDLAIEVAVMDAILDARAQGRSVTVQELCERFPGCEPEVAKAFQRATALGSTDTEMPRHVDADAPVARHTRVGPYRIESELGRGAQGVVYMAVDERLDRRVALKILLPSWAASPRTLRRFENEARTLAALDHPGICTVHEAATIDGTPFIAMRLVAGESLVARISHLRTQRDGGRPLAADVASAVAIIEKVARAANAAHEAGVIHRDLKPANVIVSDADEPTILDFGLASSAEDGDGSLTMSGDILGTPAYMAPEQAAGNMDEVDRRADIHALGVILFEMTTGRRPFDAPTRSGLLDAVCNTEAPDARRTNPEVDRDVATVIARCLAKLPSDRYASALDLADDLRRVRLLEPIAARPVSTAERALRWVRRNPLRAALITVIGLLFATLIAGGAWYLANRDRLASQEAAERRAQVEEELVEGSTAMAALRQGAAIAHYEAALRLDPSSVEAITALAICLVRRGHRDVAIQRLDEFGGRFGRSSAWYSARRFAGPIPNDPEPRATSRPDTASPRDDVSCFIESMKCTAESEIGSEDGISRACNWLEAAIQRSPTRRLLYLNSLAAVASRLNDRTTAQRIAGTLRTVLTGPRAEVLAGLALCRADPDAARATFARAEALGGNQTDIGYGMFTILVGSRDFASAAALMRDMLARRPDDATLYYNLSLAELKLDHVALALEAARRAVELRPDVAANHAQVGMILRDGLQQFAAASVEFERALACSPANLEVAGELSRCLSFKGDQPAALAMAQRVIDKDPQNVVAWRTIARARLLLDDPEAGEAAARHVVELAPEYAIHHLELARAVAANGDFEGARKIVDEWYERAVASGLTSYLNFLESKFPGLAPPRSK